MGTNLMMEMASSICGESNVLEVFIVNVMVRLKEFMYAFFIVDDIP